jgi:predicted ArsR family transcriptional regulator
MAVDRLEAVGDPGLRAALLFVRAEARPVTADDLADAQGIHRNVARSRLERLVAAGLVDAAFERRSERSGPGAGRPAKTYRAAPDLSGIEFPARHYETLLGLLAGQLPRERLRGVGAAFGQELAHAAGVRPTRRTAEGLERVCAALRSLGHQATLEQADRDEAVIATPNCPLRPLVVAQPDAVLIDEGMWAGLAEAALTGRHAEAIACEARGCLDEHASCRIHLHLQSRR